ncbi:hypothetical protein [Tenggerimyces flavus]|uniref:Succinate dehydrogenase [membrane anchor subunit] (Succinic dehydrogenase) n=1 Tax=Tenggerimyces flavus TaxID=1708749 RepID=A0ABV7YK71_9ACTN|nr:hypothetical protein [Tenggerimyces flavus]MBM7790965.1 hypothetical protein [Tenggerimyces flavus]
MASGVFSPERAKIDQRTLRRDRWWISPVITFIGFTAFVVYSTWRAFANEFYYASPYLSPFYSPCLSDACVPGSADFGTPLAFLPTWISPALIILIFPLGFRLTCYYYRKAYYRAFWQSPTACVVAEPHQKYSGETRFPLIFQNLHRWFFYAAGLVALVLTYDVVIAFRNEAHEWGHMGLGTLILLVNVVLIWLYTLSCHSCRHAVGGRLRTFSKHPVRYKAWTAVSKLNGHHAKLAWASLISVGLADFYIYLLATETITDVRFF